jgi:hypothetical protein
VHPPQDPATLDVEREDLAALGIGDIRVPAVRMARRVPRLAEAVEDVGIERLGVSTTATAPMSECATTAVPPTRSTLRGCESIAT